VLENNFKNTTVVEGIHDKQETACFENKENI
jgi:hypothetical protein